MGRFNIIPLPLEGLKLIQRRQIGDHRGFFSRFFCAAELAAAGWSTPIAQINHTLTVKAGSVRGMHYQIPPHAEKKLVACLRGEVFDVAVDIRKGSPTFLQYHAVILSGANNKSFLIPEGFAHGFQTLTDNVEMLYCHSHPYTAEAEGGLRWDDPALGIDWPIYPIELSKRDQLHSLLTPGFNGVDSGNKM